MNLVFPILSQLKQARGLLVPESALRMQLRLEVTPAPTGLEISDALNTIERNKWGVAVRDGISGDVRWKITDTALAELYERGL